MRLDPAGVPLPNRSRHAFRARYLLTGICGLSLLAAAGCGSPGSAGSTVSSTVTIAAVPGVDDAGIYLAQKDGLFAAEGLTNVRIVPYTNQGKALDAVVSGRADIAASDYGDIFQKQASQQASQQAGSKNLTQPYLRILADGYDATAGVVSVLTLPSKHPMSPSDLADATIGLPNDEILPTKPLTNGQTSAAPPSLEAAAATDVLKTYVGNAAESVKWQQMPESKEVTALTQGHIKAILVSEPYIYQAESKGAIEVLDACSGSTAGLPLLGYVAMNAWVRDNPAAVADFQAALAKAQAEAAVTGKVQGVLPGMTGAGIKNAQTADLITIGSYPTSTITANLQAVVNLMADWNVIKGGNYAPSVHHMIVNPGG